MDNSFYTYAYLRKDGTPYYIGKGKGDRAFRNRGRSVKTPPKERILLLKTGLTEEEAFKHEIYMIALYGRKDLGTGILYNFSDGGEGSSNPSEEIRRKIGAASKGRKHSEETRMKISKANKGRKRPPRSEETRRRMSVAQMGKRVWLGKKHREDSKQKISKAHREKGISKGENNPMFGRNHSESAKEKMSATKRERKVGIGRVWFHLPEENRECHFAPDALPSAPWVKGRLKRKVR
jgi:ribosomal protein L28